MWRSSSSNKRPGGARRSSGSGSVPISKDALLEEVRSLPSDVQEAMVARYLMDMGASQAAATSAAAAVVRKQQQRVGAGGVGSHAASAGIASAHPTTPATTGLAIAPLGTSPADEQARIARLMQLLAATGAMPDMLAGTGGVLPGAAPEVPAPLHVGRSTPFEGPPANGFRLHSMPGCSSVASGMSTPRRMSVDSALSFRRASADWLSGAVTEPVPRTSLDSPVSNQSVAALGAVGAGHPMYHQFSGEGLHLGTSSHPPGPEAYRVLSAPVNPFAGHLPVCTASLQGWADPGVFAAPAYPVQGQSFDVQPHQYSRASSLSTCHVAPTTTGRLGPTPSQLLDPLLQQQLNARATAAGFHSASLESIGDGGRPGADLLQSLAAAQSREWLLYQQQGQVGLEEEAQAGEGEGFNAQQQLLAQQLQAEAGWSAGCANPCPSEYQQLHLGRMEMPQAHAYTPAPFTHPSDTVCTQSAGPAMQVSHPPTIQVDWTQSSLFS